MVAVWPRPFGSVLAGPEHEPLVIGVTLILANVKRTIVDSTSRLEESDTSPVYCREGSEPEGVDPERVVIIRRTYVDPPEREAEQLPEMAAEEAVPSKFDQPLNYPILGIV
jgi:hypothetical protein